MKHLFISFIALITGISSFAQTEAEKTTETKTVTLNSAVTSVVVNDGVNVVLIDDETNDLFIEGRTSFVKAVHIKFENGELTISCTNTEASKPVAVFVSARYIKEMTVNGSSIVGSYQILQNKRLNVLINGDCKLMIRTAGSVNVIATDEYAFTYQSKKIKR
jgi:Putative auto-transporter adhesin, head GIN domain